MTIYKAHNVNKAALY